MPEDYTEDTRNAIKDNLVRNTRNYLSSQDDLGKFIGICNLRDMWQQTESGSGTNAEALSRLTAIGFGDQIDKVKELLDASDKDLAKAFGLKI